MWKLPFPCWRTAATGIVFLPGLGRHAPGGGWEDRPTPPVTLIIAFEVPPEADDRFVAGWDKAGHETATLHRALRADVDFRFVAIVQGGSTPSDELPFRAHASAYEVAREDGTPDVEGGVVLIDPFEVPPDADERFLAGWERARDVRAAQRGYLGARLHRSVGPADFRFVVVARWSSPLMFARALKQPELQEAARALPFPSHPALYQPFRG